jgi:hypothetical protein
MAPALPLVVAPNLLQLVMLLEFPLTPNKLELDTRHLPSLLTPPLIRCLVPSAPSLCHRCRPFGLRHEYLMQERSLQWVGLWLVAC